MIFHILLNQMTTLFLGLNLLTTMTFDSEIQSYLYGGGKDDVFFQVTNNQRTLAIRPKIEGDFSNLLVITKKQKYYFNLKYDKSSPHQFIEIKDGVMNHALSKKISNLSYDIFEGDHSVLFVNKRDHDVTLNGKTVKRSDYFSKGVPLILEGVKILY